MNYELAFERLGQITKKLREEKGVTQLDIAEATGIDIHTQNLLETGQYNPNISELITIAGYYNLSLTEFFADFK